MALQRKLLMIVLDGLAWRAARRLMGNLEGWVSSGEARVWRMRSVLPSTSGPCYASIHTGVPPQVHGITSNQTVRRLNLPDIFSAVSGAGGVTGAVTHSDWSRMFNRDPFDPVRDIEFDDDSLPIRHGRLHTMTGESHDNQMTPSDVDLFATLSSLIGRFGLDYGLLHTCTLDSMSHRFGQDCGPMDLACYTVDASLAAFLPAWRAAGYEVIVTADHGHSDRGHHGGNAPDMRDFPVYYFGDAKGPEEDALLDQLQLAPTILSRFGLPIPDSMQAKPFLKGSVTN